MPSKTKPKLIVPVIFIFLIFLFQCPEEPNIDNDLPKIPDTTSHAIFLEIDTLVSVGTSSQVNDVAVVDDSTIWLVGQFFTEGRYTNDNDWQTQFTISRWNSPNWAYDGIYYNDNFYNSEFYAIHIFSEDDIWISSQNLWHWSNNGWKHYHIWNLGLANENEGGIAALWGSDPDDVYFVGVGGLILHWDGSDLSRMTSNTNADLVSIAGTQGIIWTCGQDYYTHERVLLEYRDGNWQKKELPGGWTPTTGDFLSVGAYKDSLYMAGWSCLLIESAKNPDKHRMIHFSHIDTARIAGVTNYYFNDMLVLGYADIFFSCGFGRIYHYNGRSLYRYPVELDGWMTGIDGNDNFIVAIGYDMQTAYVFRGYR